MSNCGSLCLRISPPPLRGLVIAQVIHEQEDQIATLKTKMALRIPSRQNSSPPQRALAARSPFGSPAAPSFYDDTGIYVASPAAHSVMLGRRARTPPSARREVAWSDLPASDDSMSLDGMAPGPTLGAVRDMIRGMAGRMAALGSSNAAFKQQSTARQSPTRSRNGGLVAGLGRGALAAVTSSSSSDDDDVRDTSKRPDTAPAPGVPLSLLRAQQAQRMQPVSPRKPTGDGTPGRKVHEGGCKAVQTQLRVLSANYKQLRQRGAV